MVMMGWWWMMTSSLSCHPLHLQWLQVEPAVRDRRACPGERSDKCRLLPPGGAPPVAQGAGQETCVVRGGGLCGGDRGWGGGGWATFVRRAAGDPTIRHSRWSDVAWLSTLMTVLIHLTCVSELVSITPGTCDLSKEWDHGGPWDLQ